MYKGACLNPQLARIFAETGHTDTICVTDAGFPVPKGPERVDLAWKRGNPEWLEVCRMAAQEMVIEQIYLAEELKSGDPDMIKAFIGIFPEVPIAFITHEELKKMSGNTRAVIRTGECTPFCNCILRAGVDF